MTKRNLRAWVHLEIPSNERRQTQLNLQLIFAAVTEDRRAWQSSDCGPRVTFAISFFPIAFILRQCWIPLGQSLYSYSKESEWWRGIHCMNKDPNFLLSSRNSCHSRSSSLSPRNKTLNVFINHEFHSCVSGNAIALAKHVGMGNIYNTAYCISMMISVRAQIIHSSARFTPTYA